MKMHTLEKTSLSYLLINFLVIFSLLVTVILFQQTLNALEQTVPTVSIIIDDLGDRKALGFRAANLPSEVALSILPHTPFSQEIAQLGHHRGMDILLHQPMESEKYVELLGPGALLSNMKRQQFAKTLENNINAIPYVVGINNHMGSLLTADREKMNWLMAELKQRALFFIDSRTTTKTIAATTAKHWQIPSMSRRVFLDHYDDPESIDNQFKQLLRIARKQGHAIAIGHPRENTMRYLEQKLPELAKAGVKLVSPSELMHTQLLQQLPPASERFFDNCYNRNIRSHSKFVPLFTLEENIYCNAY
ncbi:MAG: divergent polysaccharide deacetylase family protein [Gammaproteobacteria bacterium]|nr:divergent polysaccharide deacetylase family protein [Gammaproteobacteria bacterium]